jgi:hypothetical protein
VKSRQIRRKNEGKGAQLLACIPMRRWLVWLVVLLVLAGYGYFFLFPEKALSIVDKLVLATLQ